MKWPSRHAMEEIGCTVLVTVWTGIAVALTVMGWVIVSRFWAAP